MEPVWEQGFGPANTNPSGVSQIPIELPLGAEQGGRGLPGYSPAQPMNAHGPGQPRIPMLPAAPMDARQMGAPRPPYPPPNGHRQPPFYNGTWVEPYQLPPSFFPPEEGGKPRDKDAARANGKTGKPGSSEQGGAAHQDALMELARENLLLKHQLHVASIEVNRLKDVVDSYGQKKEDKKEFPKQSQSRYWSEDEHQRFLVAIDTYGHKDVKAIASVVGTRSATQVRTHAQKYFMKLARSRQGEDKAGKPMVGSNPDQDPSEMAEDADQSSKSLEAAAAAAAAAGEAGTSAAAAAAFVAAAHHKQNSALKQRSAKQVVSPPANGKPSVSIDAKGPKAAAGHKNGRKGPGSPGSMGSSGSVGCSDSTSNGNGSNGVRSSDTTTANGSTGSSNSHGNGSGNGNRSSSDSGRCGDSNNVSSTEGSEHGFFDTGAEEEENFPDELPDSVGADGLGLPL